MSGDSGQWVVSGAASESQLTRRKGIHGGGTGLDGYTGREKGVASSSSEGGLSKARANAWPWTGAQRGDYRGPCNGNTSR